jgi:nucleotide-binding universal stress UspA family protein
MKGNDIMSRRIIVPLDRSQISEGVLPLARELASRASLPVTLMTVLDVPSQFAQRGYERGGPSGLPMQDPFVAQSTLGRWPGFTDRRPSQRQMDALSRRVREAERYLQEVARTFDDVTVETTVQLGRPAERILAVAEQRSNSYIAMASHGRSGLRRTLLGSVASRVIQGAPSAVFVQRRADVKVNDPHAATIDRVLVPLDGSYFAEQAIESVDEFFGPTEVQLHLLYVVEHGAQRDTYTQEILEDYRDLSDSDADAYLDWVAQTLIKSGSRVSSEIAHGLPADEIERVATERGADLIAMSTHGRSGIGRFVMGSTAERVLQSSECPLMLIRAWDARIDEGSTAASETQRG